MVQIRDSLTKRAREFNILVDDVAITHLSFGTEVDCCACPPALSYCPALLLCTYQSALQLCPAVLPHCPLAQADYLLQSACVIIGHTITGRQCLSLLSKGMRKCMMLPYRAWSCLSGNLVPRMHLGIAVNIDSKTRKPWLCMAKPCVLTCTARHMLSWS